MNSLIKYLAIVALIAVPAQVLAQRDAGSKARGDYSGTFWSARSAARSIGHARDYVTSAHEYVKATPKPNAEYLRAESADIGKNLESTKAEVAYLKKNSAADKETAAAITSIEKHLTAAEAEYKTFHAACAKESIESKDVMDCCSALTSHLEKAHNELQALAKKLAPKK